MKLIIVLLTAGLLQVSASTFGQKLTFSQQQVSLAQVFKEIKLQTGYNVFYSSDEINDAKKTSVNFKNTPLAEALDELLKNMNLSWSIQDRNVVVRRKELALLDQLTALFKEINVHGQVSGGGFPLAGATIVLKGSNRATRTAVDGTFFFDNVDEKEILIISYMGYETKEVKAKVSITVDLSAAVSRLNEVAVVSTGYQDIKKERATGSFSKPDMAVFKNRAGTMDIVARLEGLVPGLVIRPGLKGLEENNQLGNGNTSQKSTIRGESSIQLNTNPLFVVDGVAISNLNLFNPDDIEDITVLKDAAAAAIWGARAANGVVVIKTKSGTKNGTVNISYSGFLNYQGRPDYRYGKAMNSQQFIQAAKETFDPQQYPLSSLGYYSVVAPHEQILYGQFEKRITEAEANKALDSLASINNLDQVYDLFYRNASTQNHTVSISGGSNMYSFYSSANFVDVISNRINESNKNYRLSFNQSFSLGSRLKLSLNTTLGNSVSSQTPGISISNNFLPYQLFQDVQGRPITMNYLTGFSPELLADWSSRSRINLDYTPLMESNYGYSKRNNTHINLLGSINLNLFKGLSFNGSYGLQKAPGQNKVYLDHKSYELRSVIVSSAISPSSDIKPSYLYPTTGGRYTVSDNEERNWTLRNQLIYSRSVRHDRDQLNLQLGQEAQESFGTSTTNTLIGYDEHLLTHVVLPPTFYRGTVTGAFSYADFGTAFIETQKRFTSYFALFNYTMNGKYSLDASWRTDKSSLFGVDFSAQNRPVWSIGGLWNIRKENFMSALTWLDNLALKATYGITGNSPGKAGATQADVLSIIVPSMSQPLAGNYMEIINPKNGRLSWESTQTTNLGINFSLFNSRISGGIDVYFRKTTNLLGQMDLNRFTGWTSALGNLGELSNKGIELSLQTRNLESRNLNWTSSFNIGYNKNKLVNYSGLDPRIPLSSIITGSLYLPGYSTGPLFSYPFAGLNAEGNPQVRLADGTITAQPDAISREDLIYEGSVNPPYSGGIGNTFRYKLFSLTANLIFNLGNVMRADVNDTYTGRISTIPTGFLGNLTTDFMDRWRKPGDEQFTNVPAYVSSFQQASARAIEYYTYGNINVLSASYAKIRDITLAYNLPTQVLQRLKIKTASLSVQATNFMVWKNNKLNIDPEYNGLNVGARNIPPFRHSYTISANVTF